MIPSWIRRRLVGTSRAIIHSTQSPASCRQKLRLGVEALEDRWAPAADHLAFSLNPVASITSGTLFNVQVQARDSGAGNAVDLTFVGNVTLTAAAAGGSNFTAGNVVPAIAGVASFSVFLNNAADNYQITASAAGLTDGLSSTFNITADHLAVLAIGNVRAGDALGVTVNALDASNTIAENFTGTVNLDAAAAGGSNFNGGTASVAAALGVATFAGLALNNAANAYTATASSAGLTDGVSGAFNVTASSLAVLPVADVRAGDAFNVTAEARDANNVVAENFTGNVSIDAAATGGSNFVGGTQNAAAALGVASFVGVVLRDAADTYAITAASAGLTSGVSNNFNVTFTTLTVGAVADVIAGAPFNVTVTATDANGANAENFGAANGLTLINLQAAVLANGQTAFDSVIVPTFLSGVATFTGLSISNAADGYTFSAQATSSGNVVTDAIDASFDVTAVTFRIIAPPRVRSTAAFSVTVEAVDAQAVPQVAENFTGTITLAQQSGPGTLTGLPGVPPAAVAGSATFPGLALDDAGDYVLSATNAGVATGLANIRVTANQVVFVSLQAPFLTANKVRAAHLNAADPGKFDVLRVVLQGRDVHGNIADIGAQFELEITRTVPFTGKYVAAGFRLDAVPTLGLIAPVQLITAAGPTSIFHVTLPNFGKYFLTAKNFVNSPANVGTLGNVNSAVVTSTARQLVIVSQPQVAIRQFNFPFNVIVQARDAFGAVDPFFTQVVHVTTFSLFANPRGGFIKIPFTGLARRGATLIIAPAKAQATINAGVGVFQLTALQLGTVAFTVVDPTNVRFAADTTMGAVGPGVAVVGRRRPR